MIAGIFHEGSGLGDQLFRYITVRTLAEDKGYTYGMQGTFKGDFFLDRPRLVSDAPLWLRKAGVIKLWNEKKVIENGLDVRSYDPEINFVEDNTIVDGSFEDNKYWRHNLLNINKWLSVEQLNVLDDLCVIGFRGGEYYTDSNLGLPTSYYEQAVIEMHKINPKMRFEVHTDDPQIAELMLTPIFGTNQKKITYVPNKRINHSRHTNMGFNWRNARYAKYAIIPNSAFFILPRILRHANPETSRANPRGPITIAPRYWARRNTKIWARPACYYPEFRYI